MNTTNIINNKNINSEFQFELKKLFRNEINKLSNVIDRNLNLWIK